MIKLLARVSMVSFCVTASPHFALADSEFASIIERFVVSTASKSSDECYDAYERILSRDPIDRRVDSRTYGGEVFDLAHEGLRLRCESLRLLREAKRLEGERDRLLAEAERLDQMWERYKLNSNGGLREYSGHDKSQRRLRRDADILIGTIGVLEENARSLERESRRILSLARASIDDLDESEVESLMFSLNAKSKNDIIRRLIGDENLVS